MLQNPSIISNKNFLNICLGFFAQELDRSRAYAINYFKLRHAVFAQERGLKHIKFRGASVHFHFCNW